MANTEHSVDYRERNPREYHGRVPNDELATQTVVQMLASIENCEPIDIGPLADFVDTDSLNKLVDQTSDENLEIRFTIEEYTARVSGDRSIVLVAE